MADRILKGVIIYAIERHPRSGSNGNPRFRFATSEGIFPTQIDAAVGYASLNYEPFWFYRPSGRRVRVNPKVDITLNSSDQIIHITGPDSSDIRRRRERRARR